MNDGVGGGGCVGEEMRTGGTRGGWRSLVASAVELNDKKNRDTGGPFPSMATNWRNYTTINLKLTRDGGGAMERRCDRGWSVLDDAVASLRPSN